MFSFNIMQVIYTLPALLIALTFHEFSHGLAAYYLGDNTAKVRGRLTLNPIKHIDPIGLFTLLVFKFGWAKPVPFNPLNFKNRKWGTLIVALAGPFSNFILAFLSFMLLLLINPVNPLFFIFLNSLFLYNLILCVFNLIPVPPLDGSKIIASILPVKQEALFYQYERYGYPLLLILIVTGILDYILYPAINFFREMIISIASIILRVL